jgi:hypothetical protein
MKNALDSYEAYRELRQIITRNQGSQLESFKKTHYAHLLDARGRFAPDEIFSSVFHKVYLETNDRNTFDQAADALLSLCKGEELSALECARLLVRLGSYAQPPTIEKYFGVSGALAFDPLDLDQLDINPPFSLPLAIPKVNPEGVAAVAGKLMGWLNFEDDLAKRFYSLENHQVAGELLKNPEIEQMLASPRHKTMLRRNSLLSEEVLLFGVKTNRISLSDVGFAILQAGLIGKLDLVEKVVDSAISRARASREPLDRNLKAITLSVTTNGQQRLQADIMDVIKSKLHLCLERRDMDYGQSYIN